MDVHSAIKIIQDIPEAKVDRNFGQGDSVLEAQVTALHGDIAPALKDEIIQYCQLELSRLIQMVSPYSLPEDYLCFLRFYGGLSIGQVAIDSPLLTLFGIGPATDIYYPHIEEVNEGIARNIEQLYIASIYFPVYDLDRSRRDKSIGESINRSPFDKALDLPPSNLARRIYLDLAGAVQQNSILYKNIDPRSLKHLGWIKVANTFSDWLELIARDGGRFQRLTDSPILSEGL